MIKWILVISLHIYRYEAILLINKGSDSELMINLNKRPKKGFRIAQLNVWNKLKELKELMLLVRLHILAISEAHLDSTFDISEVIRYGVRKGFIMEKAYW